MEGKVGEREGGRKEEKELLRRKRGRKRMSKEG